MRHAACVSAWSLPCGGCCMLSVAWCLDILHLGMDVALADDYDLAMIFVDELIPHAVDWYTGEARD